MKNCRRINLLIVWLLLWTASGLFSNVSAADSADTPLDGPKELATEAIAANPGLKAIDNQVTALKHKADAVQVWLDPVFSVSYLNVPWNKFSLGDSPMSGLEFRLQQSIPLPGKNSRREAVALGEAKVMKWQLEEQKNQLKAMVKRTYWSLSLVRQLKTITAEHVKLVGQLLEAVRAKYHVGKAAQHELLQLDVLRQKLTDDLADFEKQDRELVAVLNAALHREVTTPIETPPATPTVEPPAVFKELFATAKKHRPLLERLKALAKTKRLAADQAAYERWPDLTLWAGYRYRTEAGSDPGTDFMSLGLSVPLPFDYKGRYSAKRAEHLSDANAVDEQHNVALDEIQSALEAELAAWSRAAQKAQTYQKTLVPGAKSTLDSTLAAYQTDRADFASLYQAELQLLEFDRAIRAAQAGTQIQKALVEKTTGLDYDKNSNQGAL